jgi:hypothetical protein
LLEVANQYIIKNKNGNIEIVLKSVRQPVS